MLIKYFVGTGKYYRLVICIDNGSCFRKLNNITGYRCSQIVVVDAELDYYDIYTSIIAGKQ
jgi:hypothetical protein